MVSVHPLDEINVSNALGEGIQWNGEDQSVWWTDILSSKLYRYCWRDTSLQSFDMPEMLGSFAFTRAPNQIIAAFASGFAKLDLITMKPQWIDQPPFLAGEGRFNDGRADRQGRFWSGTMVANPGDGAPPTGRLFCLHKDGQTSVHQTGIHISNGICWSPTGDRMYFADSLLGQIMQFDFDPENGGLSNKRFFAQSPEGASPDGACVDTAGNVWSAQWGIGKVFAYSPKGKLICEVPIPASQPTCVAFGGPNMDILFVSSANDGLSTEAFSREPSAGNVFMFQTDATGLPEERFGGDLARLGVV